MKLTDLEPRWAQDVLINRDGRGQSHFPPREFINAITFLCPHCRAQRLAVTFRPPIGPVEWLTPGQPITETPAVWTREHDTFETLSLSPSIDTSAQFAGHWHGFITNGEVR